MSKISQREVSASTLSNVIKRKVRRAVSKKLAEISVDVTSLMVLRMTHFGRWIRFKICWWLMWRRPNRVLWLVLNTKVAHQFDDMEEVVKK